VCQSEVELQALIEEVVVPESWFFRDERPFQWLADHVRERWLAQPARPPLRVLSLPCAGGEEPYSIAITLLDLGLPARRFQIDAVDVSARRLAAARCGVYSRNAFRGQRVSLGSLARHFHQDAQGYELDPSVRATVRFLQASVLDPSLLEGSPPYHVIFCRNLLIYLSEPARACVLATLDRLLAPDGALIIGHADRLDLAGTRPQFAAAGEPGCFVYLKAACQHDADSPTPQRQYEAPPVEWVERRTAAEGPPSASAVAVGQRLDQRGSTHPTFSTLPDHPFVRGGKGTAPIDGGVLHSGPGAAASPSPSLLEQAAELANRGQHAQAIVVCERHLQLKGPDASAYYLMGMICQAAGDSRRAQDCLHKTLYLDPKHDEALLALALWADRRGDRAAAEGFRRRAQRARARPAGETSS
jgi:chemotaxis protein methyltransferase WspC